MNVRPGEPDTQARGPDRRPPRYPVGQEGGREGRHHRAHGVPLAQATALQERFEEARRDVHENAVGVLQNYSGSAAATLVKLLDSDNDHVRARAARIILDQAARGVEIYDVEERLQRLEEELDE